VTLLLGAVVVPLLGLSALQWSGMDPGPLPAPAEVQPEGVVEAPVTREQRRLQAAGATPPEGRCPRRVCAEDGAYEVFPKRKGGGQATAEVTFVFELGSP
jgi:hypothetical protein